MNNPLHRSKFREKSKSGILTHGSLPMEYSVNSSIYSNAELLKTINQLKKPNNIVYQQKLKGSLL